MKTKNPEVKVGQICWTCGGFLWGLSGRLVEVKKISKNHITVALLHPTEVELITTDSGLLHIDSEKYLFTEWQASCEGSPEDAYLPETKASSKCPSCGAKITAKMKFCSECGTALTSPTK